MLDTRRYEGDVGEKEHIRKISSRIPQGPGVTVGIGDDAAVVQTSSSTLVTTDSLVEGIHFTREWSPPRLLGRKALSVNLSDSAATAGVAQHAVVSLCLPAAIPVSFVDGFYDGLLERAAETGVNLVGGNVSATTGPVVVTVAVIGHAERPWLRSGARAGDRIVVTGHLGAAAEGLRLLAQGARLDEEGTLSATGMWTESSAESLTHCLRAQLDPAPPLAFARALKEQDAVHAAMDISDGFSGDLLEMCVASELCARVNAAALPVDPHAAGFERARGGDAFALALHGGEDYQLLLAVPPDRVDTVRDVAVVWELPITVIGDFTQGSGVSLVRDGSELPLPPRSHEHFRP
jgi:thiamine-monophosphate kinase